MSKKIILYKPVKLITDKYQYLGLMSGVIGTVFEKFSDNAFLVDFTTLDDFKPNMNGEEIINIVFQADELEPIE